ncbi:hypothetical protein ACGFIK_20720 [Micromonospora sp. NPDC048871]|uniref:hypothetical protein n=1 Tax=unclassified Micromonospora TaxID=2617518 RepID=UPI002E1324D6|nr:hypothetical protein OIE53_18710 [Micromonospora sp. NBC_01739]
MTGGADRSEVGRVQASTIAVATTLGDHAPVVPGWTCGTCGADWPCEQKRARLLSEYAADPAMLSVYLAACLAAATEDLHRCGSTSLQGRFLGWLPRRPRRF